MRAGAFGLKRALMANETSTPPATVRRPSALNSCTAWRGHRMCNLYSITTNQAAIAALFRRMNRYEGNLPAMTGVFPDYPAPVIRNTGDAEEMVLMRWGMPPPP